MRFILPALLAAISLAVPSAQAATAADAAFDQVMKEYLTIHGHLITDRFDDSSRKAAAGLNAAALSLQRAQGLAGGAAVKAMVEQSGELTTADLPKARSVFQPLSEGVDAYLKSFYTGQTKYYRLFCDMMKKPWAQSSVKPIQNPFYDKSMRDCGRLVQ